jgi:hypothetical protein
MQTSDLSSRCKYDAACSSSRGKNLVRYQPRLGEYGFTSLHSQQLNRRGRVPNPQNVRLLINVRNREGLTGDQVRCFQLFSFFALLILTRILSATGLP